MDEYEVHPAADLFPMMTDAELDALGEDMLQNAQREPIILYKGKILDGRNRYRACRLKGINPKFQEELPADPYAFVASANLHRRHLSEEQRGMIAARLATMKQGARTDLSPSGETSQAEAAKLLKVSKRRVERSHEVIEKGVPVLADAVEHGDVSVSAAAAFVRDHPPAVQDEYIAHAGSVAEAVETANAEMKAAEGAIKTKGSKRAKSPKKPKPNVPGAADRADPAKLIMNAIVQLENITINISAAAIARMPNDQRVELMVQLGRANARLNKMAIDIAISGGANLGVLSPPDLRYQALAFMRGSIARIEAELTSRDVQEPAS